MPYRRKDSLVWWASYTDASGKRVRRATGTTNRKEAVALESKWKLEAFQEQKWDQEPTRTFDELMLAYLKATEGKKKSWELDRYSAKPLFKFFSGQTLPEITGSDIRAFSDYRMKEGKSNSTIRRELALLSSAINYAVREWEWDIPNPVKGRKPKKPEGRVRWITQEESETLIDVAARSRSKLLADFIRLALNTGCRMTELLTLEWQCVDLREGLIHLEGKVTKSGKRRTIPVNAQAREALLNLAGFRASHCPGSRWVFANPDGSRLKQIRNAFKNACRKAKIENFRIHDMRHTFAAWLVTRKVPLTVIRDLLGHGSVVMTEVYAHLAPETGREAVAVLDEIGHDLVTLGNLETKTG